MLLPLQESTGGSSLKKALITGITGQDGSYLAEFLLAKGYEVWGVARRSSTDPTERIVHMGERLRLVQGDVTDLPSLVRLLEEVQPDEVYNLAAMSFVPTSWQEPVVTATITGLGVTNVLEAIRLVHPAIRFYQASSSEMFGKPRTSPQDETTPLHPRSPYGVAKAYGHWITVNYRESHGLHASSGICFNHESPRRGCEFVSRKITHTVARIKLGLADKLRLGNLDARRDWGFAGDYVKAMWRMLQEDQADDYVIATGEAHSVRDLLALAFPRCGLDWKDHVIVDPALFRPAEIEVLVGNSAKVRERLGWRPQVAFEDLLGMMVDHDIWLLRSGRHFESGVGRRAHP
jgi:GDPmannose 4,6-dehydratase